ncbi:hypothetical protein [Flavobacterium sp. TSSA_36]
MTTFAKDEKQRYHIEIPFAGVTSNDGFSSQAQLSAFARAIGSGCLSS